MTAQVSALHERLLGPSFGNEPHCVYCGTSLYKGDVCGGHADLRELDADWQAARMREWWLANYSREQIAELAQGLAA